MSISRNLGVLKFGIATAFFYAITHPFNVPLVHQTSGSVYSLIVLIVLSEVMMLAVYAVLLTNREIRRQTLGILASPLSYHKLATVALISTSGGAIYLGGIYALSTTNLSMILNVFPLWLLLSGIYLFRKSKPKNFRAILIVFLSLALVVISSNSENTLNSIKEFAIFSLVPIFYAINVHLRAKFFGKSKPLTFVLATAIFDAPIVIALGSILIWFFGREELGLIYFELQNPSSLFNLFLFFVGSISTSILGIVFLYKAFGQTNEGEDWKASACLFLVPIFTEIISNTLSIMGVYQVDSPSRIWNFLFFYSIIYGIYYWKYGHRIKTE